MVSGSGPIGFHMMHGEDQRIAPRIVVEDRLGRRIGENSAVPIELAVDANGRKGRRQRARRHDVPAVIALSRLSK